MSDLKPSGGARGSRGSYNHVRSSYALGKNWKHRSLTWLPPIVKLTTQALKLVISEFNGRHTERYVRENSTNPLVAEETSSRTRYRMSGHLPRLAWASGKWRVRRREGGDTCTKVQNTGTGTKLLTCSGCIYTSILSYIFYLCIYLSPHNKSLVHLDTVLYCSVLLSSVDSICCCEHCSVNSLVCTILKISETLKQQEKRKNSLEHISHQLCVPFLLPWDRQSVCSGHGTPLSDHIHCKQPATERSGDYRDIKPPSLSWDVERIVHPHVLNTNLSPSVTAPFITHKANPVSSTMRSSCPSSLPFSKWQHWNEH